MRSKLVMAGSLLLAGTLMPMGDTAYADSVNTGGAICRNYNASQALDIDYFTNAVRNINAASRPVVCSVPRTPLAANGTPRFYVDGRNNASTCTTCTLAMYHYSGVIAATQSFTQCAPAAAAANWDHLVTFPTLPGPNTFDYASLFCTLPGSGAGLLYGASSVAP